MEDFGTDSRMQTRSAADCMTGAKGVKTAERPIKAHSNGTLRHFHVLSLVSQAAMRLVPRPGKPCETACKNQNKNSNTLLGVFLNCRNNDGNRLHILAASDSCGNQGRRDYGS